MSEDAAARALLSLAAELDGKARYWHEKASHEATAPDAGGTAAAIARAYEVAAALARQRAQGSGTASQPASYQGVVDLIGGSADSGEVPRP